MLGGILSAVLGAGASYLGKKAGADSGTQESLGSIGNQAGHAIPNMVNLLEKPGDRTRKFMQRAFPGTTPWEQLGGGGAGYGSANVTAKNQERMQQKELQSREKIARIQARAHVIGSGAHYGRSGIQATTGALNKEPFQDYTTQVSIAEQRLPQELRNLRATEKRDLAAAVTNYHQGVRTKNEAIIQKARADVAKLLAQTEVNRDLPRWYRAAEKLFAKFGVDGLQRVASEEPVVFKNRPAKTLTGAWKKYKDRVSKK